MIRDRLPSEAGRRELRAALDAAAEHVAGLPAPTARRDLLLHPPALDDARALAERIHERLVAHVGVEVAAPEIVVADHSPGDERGAFVFVVGDSLLVHPDAVHLPEAVAVVLANRIVRSVRARCEPGAREDADADLAYAVALGLGVVGAQLPRVTDDDEHTDPDDPSDLGYLLALRLHDRGASEEEWLDVSDRIVPPVRAALEQAHALLHAERHVDGLPTSLRRGSLLRAIEGLRDQGADDPWLRARVLEPSPADFPDRWSADAESVEVLARRLLSYAGLGELDVVVEVFDDEAAGLQDAGVRGGDLHSGIAAFFAGIEGGRVHFGVRRPLLADGGAVVGAMAHEVAHAYRSHHGLVVLDRDEEEELTDATTIFLGFGVLTTNAAYEYRAEALGDLGSRWSHQQLGYLDPEDMAFLLAAQVHARGLDRAARRRIARLLGPRQRDAFETASTYLAGGLRPSRTVVSTWAIVTGLALAPIALLLAAAWRLPAHGERCDDRGSCRPFHVCIGDRCARTCERREDCAVHEVCETDAIGRGGCVRERDRVGGE